MNLNERIEQLEKLSAAELDAIEKEFNALPEDLRKEAQQKVDRELLADALYQYGHLKAEREFATFEGEGDLNKVASEEVIKNHEELENTVGENIETLYEAVGIDSIEDEVEFAKEAQAAAGLIFNGYTDALEKIAKAKPGMFKNFAGAARKGMKAVGDAAKKGAGKVMAGAKAHGRAAKAAIKKHPGKAMAAAGLTGLAAGVAGTKKMEKKASEMSVEDIQEELARLSEIDAGLDKLASFAAKKGEKAKAALES